MHIFRGGDHLLCVYARSFVINPGHCTVRARKKKKNLQKKKKKHRGRERFARTVQTRSFSNCILGRVIAQIYSAYRHRNKTEIMETRKTENGKIIKRKNTIHRLCRILVAEHYVRGVRHFQVVLCRKNYATSPCVIFTHAQYA